MYVPFFSAIYIADVKGAWMQRARDDKAFRRNKSAAAEPSATIAPLEELVSSEGEDVQQVVPV
jgi:hypothetical protein